MKKVLYFLLLLLVSAFPHHLIALDYYCDQNSIGASVYRCEAQQVVERYIQEELDTLGRIVFPVKRAARSCARQCRRSKECRAAKTSYQKKVCRRDCKMDCFAERSESVSKAYATVVADYKDECHISMSRSQCQAQDSQKYCNFNLAENGLNLYPTTSVRKFKKLKRITRKVERLVRMRLNDLVSASIEAADKIRVAVNKRANERFPGCNPIAGDYYPCEDKSGFWRVLNPAFDIAYFNLARANEIEDNHDAHCPQAGDGFAVQPTPTSAVGPSPILPPAYVGQCGVSGTDADDDGTNETVGPEGYVCCNSSSVTDDQRYCCYSTTNQHSYCL